MFPSREHLHHAYIIEDAAPTLDAVRGELETLFEFTFTGNADVAEFDAPVVTIDIARTLGDRALQKTLGSASVLLVRSGSITTEAQNALLKLLEEPPSRTYIFFVLPSAATLLPTVLSRVHVVSGDGAEAGDTNTSLFLNPDRAARLKAVEAFTGAKKTQTPAELLAEITQFETHLHSTPSWSESASVRSVLRLCSRIRSHIRSHNAVPKHLLELLAISAQK